MEKTKQIKTKIKKDPFNRTQLTIPKFLKRLANIVECKIPERFALEYWDTYQNKPIDAIIINNFKCLTLNQLAYMNQQEDENLKKAYDRMQKRFYRLIKSGDLIEGIDYYEISPSDKLSDGKFEEKYYIKIHSIPKLLYNQRNAKELFFWFMDKYADIIDTKKSIGQTYLVNKEKEIIPQILGDHNKSYVDCKGWHYDSKAEMLVATCLHKLGLKFDKQIKIHMRKETLHLLLKECPKWSKNFIYITADFMLLTEPKTVIEYWGGIGNKTYEWRMRWKKWIYEKEAIRCIDIYPPEEQNELILMDRLERALSL